MFFIFFCVWGLGFEVWGSGSHTCANTCSPSVKCRLWSFFPIAKKIAGRGGGGSIADNKIQLSGVPILQHPVVDGAQRVADDPLPLPAKLATFISLFDVFHKQARKKHWNLCMVFNPQQAHPKNSL